MLDQEINEQLGLLQKELSRLKTVTDYIDGAKENSISIISELETVQQNYTTYTDKIFNLYRQYIEELKREVEIKINEGVAQFERTGSRIDVTNRENLNETTRLIEQYKQIVEATDKLITTIEAVDFPTRLSTIDINTRNIRVALKEEVQLIENNLSDNQKKLMLQFKQQRKEMKLIKTILFFICGLIVIGTLGSIFI